MGASTQIVITIKAAGEVRDSAGRLKETLETGATVVLDDVVVAEFLAERFPGGPETASPEEMQNAILQLAHREHAKEQPA